MICRLEIYNKELNLFPVVSSSSMTLQITLGNIIKGDKGDPGEPGKDGEDGQPGKDGKDGVNGKSPYIGDNGNWFEYDESGNPVDTGVKAKTENVVEYSEIGGTKNKCIRLSNNDAITGESTSDILHNLCKVSDKDVVEIGSPALPMNLNTLRDKRITVQELGQTIEQAHQIAYLSDLEGLKSDDIYVVDYMKLMEGLSGSLDQDFARELVSKVKEGKLIVIFYDRSSMAQVISVTSVYQLDQHDRESIQFTLPIQPQPGYPSSDKVTVTVPYVTIYQGTNGNFAMEQQTVDFVADISGSSTDPTQQLKCMIINGIDWYDMENEMDSDTLQKLWDFCTDGKGMLFVYGSTGSVATCDYGMAIQYELREDNKLTLWGPMQNHPYSRVDNEYFLQIKRYVITKSGNKLTVKSYTTSGYMLSGEDSMNNLTTENIAEKFGGSSEGQVLTKTSDGVKWKTPETSQTSDGVKMVTLSTAIAAGDYTSLGSTPEERLATLQSMVQPNTIVQLRDDSGIFTGMNSQIDDQGQLILSCCTVLKEEIQYITLTLAEENGDVKVVPSAGTSPISPECTTADNNKVLTVVGGKPTWQTPTSGGSGEEEIGSDMDPGLIKFFSVFGITYNEATNLFEYRDFDNLSIDEVLEAYKYYVPVFGPNTAFLYHNAQIMFNIMPPSTDNHQLYGNFEDRNADYMFAGCTAEVVYLCKEGDDEQFSVASCESIFASCDNLRMVVGRLDVYHASRLPALSFQCPNLEEISIYNLNCDIFLDNCPKLSAESLRFMAIHSYYQSHHNIHVHPDVWAKIQDVNNTDYHPLLELEGPSNYNVTFVEAS